MVDKITFHPEHCRAARALLGITQQQLAEAAVVGRMTVKRFELGQSVRPAQIAAIRLSLERLGVTFLLEGDEIDGRRVKAGVVGFAEQ